MKKFDLKSVALGIVIGATLIGSVGLAAVGRNIWAEFPGERGISILINGELLVPTDVTGRVVEPFIVDGTTFVPIRAISQAFGNNVEWDGINYAVYIDDLIDQARSETIKSQMVGHWRMDWPNPDNAVEHIILSNGRLGDHSRFIIHSEENGIYFLRVLWGWEGRFHITSDYIFDAQNDRLGVMMGACDEPVSTTWFYRL